jgi:hypothetical protein
MRESEGLAKCSRRWPQHPVHWCVDCSREYIDTHFSELFEAYDRTTPEGPAEETAPCPLDHDQAEAYQLWLNLSADERPAWSLEQIRTPSPN